MSVADTVAPVRDHKEVNRLVTENMRLVHFFVNKWPKIDPDDALSAGMQGLLRAAETWDETRGVPFSAYASQKIGWSIGAIRQRALTLKRGGGKTILSLNQEVGEEGSAELGELVADQNAITASTSLDNSDEFRVLRAVLRRLPKDQREVLNNRFGLNGGVVLTLERIACAMGLSRERVRQIETLGLEAIAGIKRRGEFRLLDSREGMKVWRKRKRVQLNAKLNEWHRKNPEKRREYRNRYRPNVLLMKARWYLKNRQKISKRISAKYFSNPEPAKLRAKLWREKNVERYTENKIRYRAKKRKYLRELGRTYAAKITDGYIRCQLFKRNLGARSIDSFTADEISAHRAHLQCKRARAGNPKCPTCGAISRKDGFFRPSGNQRYSCKACKKTFGLLPPAPATPITPASDARPQPSERGERG